MKITLKLYAQLGDALPPSARHNQAEVEVATDSSIYQIIDQFKVPRHMIHLVLVNGVYIEEAGRNQPGQLKPGDALAIWPPVAGG